MIRTQGLEEYLEYWLGDYHLKTEHAKEIIKRLRERDKLKKEVEELKSSKK